MSFAPNPLSLSVPEPAFESWLRDSGYLELLDHRTTQLHHLHSTSSPHTATAATTTPPSTTLPPPSLTTTTTTTITALFYTLTMSLISSLTTFLSIFTLNPFAKLTSSDFSSHANGGLMSSSSWTGSGFIGSFETYSFPSSATQARMRVHENVKRFALHYSVLSLIFFACSLWLLIIGMLNTNFSGTDTAYLLLDILLSQGLTIRYQRPVALIGLLSCLAMWELFRFCDARWMLERYPSSRQILIHVFQLSVAAVLFWCNVQVAVFWAVAVSYAVLIMHASFRKLTPAKQPSNGRGRR